MNSATVKEKGFIGAALALALPIALQNLLTSSANLIDTAMVVNLGNTATSAIGIAGRYAFLLNVVSFGFCSGCATLISQYWGADEKENVRRAYGTALLFSVSVAVLFSAALFSFPGALMRVFSDDAETIALGAEYLKIYAFATVFLMFSQVTSAAMRATESVYPPLFSSMLAVAVNTFFNYVLINGRLGFPKLGIRGAAVATLISAAVLASAMLVFILLRDNAIKGKPSEIFGIGKKFVAKYFRISFPVLLNETLWAVGTNIYVMIIARQGTENHSGYTIYETIQQLCFVFFVGMCHACAILVGKSVGAGEHDRAYGLAKKFMLLTPCMGAVVGIIIILLRAPLLSLLPIETEGARAVASSLLLFYGIWMGIRNIPYTAICGIFRAGGDTKVGCKLDLGGLYLTGIPVVVILGLFTKIPFFWLVACMYFAEDIPKAFMCIRHFRSRKWIKQLTGSSVDKT